MFCSKCGKMIDSGEICGECLEKETAKQKENNAPMQQQNNEPIEGSMPYQQYQPQYQPQYPPQHLPQYQQQYQQQYYQYQRPYNPMPDPKNRMYGFGKALTATILSYVSFALTYIAIIIYSISIESPISLTVFALPPAIISIIFGAKSISTFKARAKTCAKPIATLILGIEGLSMGATSALLIFLFFMMDFTISALYYY